MTCDVGKGCEGRVVSRRCKRCGFVAARCWSHGGDATVLAMVIADHRAGGGCSVARPEPCAECGRTVTHADNCSEGMTRCTRGCATLLRPAQVADHVCEPVELRRES